MTRRTFPTEAAKSSSGPRDYGVQGSKIPFWTSSIKSGAHVNTEIIFKLPWGRSLDKLNFLRRSLRGQGLVQRWALESK